MEDMGMLDPNNDIDIYCLNLCTKPLLQKTLSEWADGWNSHPVSTECNFTPKQMFTSGLLDLKNQPSFHPELHQVNM